MPKDQRQSRMVAVRFTVAEYRKLERLAESRGSSVSDCIRRSLGFLPMKEK
jgi:hypothetical protein